jgi:hypothetical protein
MEPKDMENQEREAPDRERDIPDEPGAAQDAERDWLGDHPELAPDESRISVVTGEDPEKESIRRTANTGDIVDDAGDAASGAGPNAELSFDRSSDYMGSEASVAETEEFARGSGSLAGKLWGEDAIGAESGEPRGPEGAGAGETTAVQGFDPSAKQEANRRSAEPGSALTGEGEPDQGDRIYQGRDLGDRPQVTATQAFGRDIGASGLPGERAIAGEGADRPRRANRPSDWTAVLGRLGGSSPGSEENLQLAEKFAAVRFPATREEVLRCLPAVAEFRVRTVSVDLREAIAESRAQSFRNMYDLIDAVKDEIRRAEKRQPNPA